MEKKIKKCEDNEYSYGACRECYLYKFCTAVKHILINAELALGEQKEAA